MEFAFTQPKEVFGTFLSMHKKHETSGTVFVEGLTLLPQRQAVLLLMAFLPPSAVKTFSVSFGLSGKLTITGCVWREELKALAVVVSCQWHSILFAVAFAVL